jgi:hypothetical protein
MSKSTAQQILESVYAKQNTRPDPSHDPYRFTFEYKSPAQATGPAPSQAITQGGPEQQRIYKDKEEYATFKSSYVANKDNELAWQAVFKLRADRVAAQQAVIPTDLTKREYADDKELDIFEAAMDAATGTVDQMNDIAWQAVFQHRATVLAASSKKRPRADETQREVDKELRREKRRQQQEVKKKALLKFRALVEEIEDGSFETSPKFVQTLFKTDDNAFIGKNKRVDKPTTANIGKAQWGYVAWALTYGRKSGLVDHTNYLAPDVTTKDVFEDFLQNTLNVADDFAGPAGAVRWDALY